MSTNLAALFIPPVGPNRTHSFVTNFYLRDFLYSEITAAFDIAIIQNDLDSVVKKVLSSE